MLEEIQSKIVPIEQLEVWQDNPRFIQEKDFARLKRQIQQLGEYKPLIVYPENGKFIVLGGNMRLRAYRELGKNECWISICDPKTDKEKLELALSDNDRAGEYDDQKLAELIYPFKDEIKLEDFKVDLGKPIDLGMVLDRFGPTGEDDFDADAEAEKIGELQSKRGEIYELGRHKLMCGDATSREDVEKLMDGQKADMVFTDPPYAVNYGADQDLLNKKSGGKFRLIARPIIGDNLTTEECAERIWKPAFKNLYKSAKDDCSFYLTMCQGGDQMMMMMMMMSEHWQIKHELIWVKSSPVFSMGRLDYDYQHEPILFGWKKKHNWYGLGKFLKSIWQIDKPSKSDLHPTQKPIELIINCILNSSLKDNIIIDLFGGSGSTLIACQQTDRICFMMEIDPLYVDVIRERYRRFVNA